MKNKKIILVIIVLLLIAGNGYFGYNYWQSQKELHQIQAVVNVQQKNEKVLNFFKTFVTKVLKAEGEVSFETRLRLENMVRDLDDKEILTQWQKFTESKTEDEAQNNVKDLLELLVNKISKTR